MRMQAKIRTKSGPVEIRENMVDQIIRYFDPLRGQARFRSRLLMAWTGGYTAGSVSRRQTKLWSTVTRDADADILPDLKTLRDRSRDLIRNNPIATGAMLTKKLNVVGSGFKLNSQIDRDIVNMSDDQAEAWEAKTEREWRLFWESKECDIARTLTGQDITRMAYSQALENGDVFIILPRQKLAFFPYDLRLQVIEADRVCNDNNAGDTLKLAGGVEKDDNGAPVAYHIMTAHPGSIASDVKRWTWITVPAFASKTGLRNVIHLYAPIRPGQTRGVPDLAPIMEPLKQLDRYTEAELMAAVVAGMFTVFIESDSGGINLDLSGIEDDTGSTTTEDYALGNGAIVGLAKGEKINVANPGRPNAVFDAFTQAILRQVGVALGLPFEILIKNFTASYSASQAAILEALKYYISERQWLIANFIQPIYEIWMYEAVAKGRIAAPGFFTDALIRQAYLGAEWIGPARGMIDETKEVEAAGKRLELGLTTRAEETARLTGGDWEKKHVQSVKEHNKRKEDGLEQAAPKAAAIIAPPPPPEPPPQEGEG